MALSGRGATPDPDQGRSGVAIKFLGRRLSGEPQQAPVSNDKAVFSTGLKT
jgi:hypothetical protein